MDYVKLYSSELIDHTKDRFMNVWREVKDQTLLTPDRLWHLWVLSRATMHLEGDMAECGTYMGGSARLISKATEHQKPLHIFDTFEGMPTEHVLSSNGCAPGDLACSLDRVRGNLADCGNTIFHKGKVPNTLAEVQDVKFSFVYLDMDLYRPTMDALHFFWSRLVTGGVIVLDDYEGIRSISHAVDDFFVARARVGDKYKFVKTTVMQCAFVKR